MSIHLLALYHFDRYELQLDKMLTAKACHFIKLNKYCYVFKNLI